MPLRPKQLARLGTFHIHEAVLDVLLHAYENEECIGAAEISRSAGLYRESGICNMNDALVHGCLNELHDQGKVERCTQPNDKGGWQLTREEYNRRRDDV